jgi:hypothetical protein
VAVLEPEQRAAEHAAHGGSHARRDPAYSDA